MCFIGVNVKLKQDPQALLAVLKLFVEEQSDNKDGTGAYCYNIKEPGSMYRREMKVSKETIAEDLATFDIVNYHFRFGTGGLKDETNIHFWKMGNWLFAHNGTVSNYGDKTHCDSFNLFTEMFRRRYFKSNGYVAYEKIAKFINETMFWGRFLAINTQTKRMYFFGDWHCYLLNRNNLLIGSATCDLKTGINFLGLEFDTDESAVEILEADMDGIFMYDPKKGFVELSDTFKKTYTNSYYNKTDTKDKEEKEDVLIKTQTELELTYDDYETELMALEQWYNFRTQQISELGYEEANLKEFDALEDEYSLKLLALEEKYIEIEKQAQKEKHEKEVEQKLLNGDGKTVQEQIENILNG